MKRLFFFAAVALVALASCSSDEMVSQSPPPETTITDPETPAPIVFSSASKSITRADLTGAEAAAKLGNAFVVSGYKGSQATWNDNDNNIVFDNYKVEWSENTAHTTESNTKNWEYVGKGRIKHAIDNGITSQTIKYWDYSQPQYNFIAWSTGEMTAVYEGTPLGGEVLVSAITPKTATGTGAGKVAYTFTGTAADLSQCYIADLVTVKKADYGDNPVTFRFRQLGTKVRIGIYETIPGYSVKDVEFYSAAASNDAQATTPKLFTTTANNIFTGGKYTVTFPTVDATSDPDNNQAHVSFDAEGAGQSTVVEWGGLNYTIAEEGEKTEGLVFLGRTSNTASFAGNADNNYYVVFLPNESGTNLNLRVNYTLESIDGGGETIKVKGATAQVPSIYTTWKPGFAYTYLFKISDKTNGYTGEYDPEHPDDLTYNSEPAGLYPITFDAVVVDAEEDGKTQETITLVSTPSITTYQEGSNVVDNNEYTPGNNIYVTVSDGNSETTPDLANSKLVKLEGKVALYILSEDKTEAEVIDALQMQDDDASPYTIKGRSGLGLSVATFSLGSKIRYGVDGNVITAGNMRVLNFAPVANNTYAFVYTKKAPTNDEVKYQALAWDDFVTGQTKYRYEYKVAEGTYCQKGVKYFSKNTSDVYTMITPFVGQSVNNLYVKDGDNYVIASGLVVPGTQYYYTTDHGMTYKECYVVSYNTARAAGRLYTFDGTDYTAKAAGAPVDGTAYYYLDGAEYKYAVILPQKTDNLYELDTNTYVKATETAEVVGQTYFDKYTKNDGVYYTKVIKVQ